jgi:galactose oxidase-like protein
MTVRPRAIGFVVAAIAAIGAAPAAGAGLDLPAGPQLQDLPGASSIPNLSTVPGAPSIPGITNNGVDNTAGEGPAQVGAFGTPFAEPGPNCPHEFAGSDGTAADIKCKPAAVSVVMLPDGRILYWDGLEAEENINLSIVNEIGDKAVNDQSRVLDLSGPSPSWIQPTPVDGGANGTDYTEHLLPNLPAPLNQVFGDQGQAPGALFCSDQVFLANGDVLVPGGTHYYEEPRLPGSDLGVSELEGLRDTRVFDPVTNTWSQSGRMHHGRWYPSLVTLADGRVLVAGGVTKLAKPIYPSHPLDSLDNVAETETFDPSTGQWTQNPQSANHTFPLFPRLHLLPDGNVYYDAAGQVFNPFGESIYEPMWNIAAVYNPSAQSWKNVGVPFGVSVDANHLLNTGVTAGFRGSSFSIMLPLKPPYTQASFLSAGGVLGVTPGAYLANASSQVDTVDTAAGDKMTSKATSPLNNARWFSTGVMLPDGKVMAFSGGNRDDVLGPGTSFPVKQAEEFDPATGKWTPMASGNEPRTYHNTAILLPTGQVLVGGHSPISTLDAYNTTIPGGFPPGFRNPSFEVYNPPYMYWGDRPTISGAPDQIGYGHNVTIATPDAADIDKVELIRNTALTHLVDGDQREVELPVVSRNADSVTVASPPRSAVAPPGPYMLFIDAKSDKGDVPSVAKQLFVR